MANASRKGPSLGHCRAYIADGTVTKYAAVMDSSDAADGSPRCKLPTGTGVQCVGIAQNDADDTEVVTVCYDGESYVKANADFAIADLLSVAATDGDLDTATTTQFVIAKAKEAAGAAGDLVVAQVCPTSKLP